MTAMANTRHIKPGASTAPGRTVHTIKVTLAGSQPPIWRRLQVPSAITLRALHDVLQAAFGWQDYHMWVFETPLGRYGLPDPELEISNAAAKRLGQVAARKGSQLSYTYDFGDDWEHDIVVEAIAGPNRASPTPAAWPAAARARPKTAAASGATTTSSRSSPTPSTKNTMNGWNGSASIRRPVRPRSLRPSPGQHRPGRPRDHPHQKLTTARPAPAPRKINAALRYATHLESRGLPVDSLRQPSGVRACAARAL